MTLFSKSQTLHIASSPQGATVYLDHHYIGETPCRISLKGAGPQRLTISKNGYTSQQIKMPTKTRGGLWWNLFFPLGFLIDAGSNSACKYTQTFYNVHLEKQEQSTFRSYNDSRLDGNQKKAIDLMKKRK